MTATFVPDDDFIRIADICTTLGVPDDDQVLFWRWADELPSAKAVDELNSYVDVLIAERCRRPADDELSELIALGLTDDEIRRRVAVLVAKTCGCAEIDVAQGCTRTSSARRRFGR